jgi:hypothetical protein
MWQRAGGDWAGNQQPLTLEPAALYADEVPGGDASENDALPTVTRLGGINRTEDHVAGECEGSTPSGGLRLMPLRSRPRRVYQPRGRLFLLATI